MSDHCDIVARCAAQSTAVTGLLFHVRNHSTFGELTNREDISDSQGSVLSSVDELTGVQAFVCDECLGSVLELVLLIILCKYFVTIITLSGLLRDCGIELVRGGHRGRDRG